MLRNFTDKGLYITIVAIVTAGMWEIFASDNANVHSRESIIFFASLIVFFGMGMYVFYRINKTREDVVQKYEEDLFRKEVEKKWLNEQYGKVCELLKYSDGSLEVLALVRVKNAAVLEMDGMKMELSLPVKKYTGQEIREALLLEKIKVEKQLKEITLPEKPKKYLWWEKRFKLDAIQVA